MKKLLIAVNLLFILLAYPFFSAEWGGAFVNNTEVSSTDFSSFPIVNAETLNLWVNKEISGDDNWYFSSQISYTNKINIPTFTPSDITFSNIIDLDLFKFSGNFDLAKSTVSLDIGRFAVKDNSSIIFDQLCDGALLRLSAPVITCSLYVGYTGLLNSQNLTMLAPKRDDSGAVVYYEKQSAIYSLSHSFLPLIATFDFPAIKGTQSLSLQFQGYFDLQTVEGIEKSDRYYGLVELRGPFGGLVYYDLLSAFGIDMSKTFTNYSKILISIYSKSIFSCNFGAEYASGKHGPFSRFTGVTSKLAYHALSNPEYGGLLLPLVDFTLSGDKLYLDIICKAVIGLPETSFVFSGVDGQVALYFDIFSDLQLGFNLAAFMDMTSGFAGPETNYTANVNLKYLF
ncbi:MAG: hypothetical protein K5866_06485 [Treponema sp.]|nr:hypothetical protein [Treponema sp.]